MNPLSGFDEEAAADYTGHTEEHQGQRKRAGCKCSRLGRLGNVVRVKLNCSVHTINNGNKYIG